jgi:hypothetical protein
MSETAAGLLVFDRRWYDVHWAVCPVIPYPHHPPVSQLFGASGARVPWVSRGLDWLGRVSVESCKKLTQLPKRRDPPAVFNSADFP